VLVVMDQFTPPPRRHRRALRRRYRRRPLLHVQRRHSRAGCTATSQHGSRSLFEHTGGRRTCGSWRSMKSKPCRTCAVASIRGAGDWDDAARISRPCAVLECRDLERKLADSGLLQRGTLPRVMAGDTPLNFAGGHTLVLRSDNVRWVSPAGPGSAPVAPDRNSRRTGDLDSHRPV